MLVWLVSWCFTNLQRDCLATQQEIIATQLKSAYATENTRENKYITKSFKNLKDLFLLKFLNIPSEKHNQGSEYLW